MGGGVCGLHPSLISGKWAFFLSREALFRQNWHVQKFLSCSTVAKLPKTFLQAKLQLNATHSTYELWTNISWTKSWIPANFCTYHACHESRVLPFGILRFGVMHGKLIWKSNFWILFNDSCSLGPLWGRVGQKAPLKRHALYLMVYSIIATP